MRVWIYEHPVIWGAIVATSALLVALLQEPLLHGNSWGLLLTASTVGLPFAVMISTLDAFTSAEKDIHTRINVLRGFAILWLGMPLALAAGGTAVGLIDKSLPFSQTAALNRVLFYAAALITSGLIWALALTLWLNIRRGYRAGSVYGRAFLIVAITGVVASILASATGHVIQKSVLTVVVSTCEQLASALYLLVVTRTDQSTGSSYA